MLREIALELAALSPLGAPTNCVEELFRRRNGRDIKPSRLGVQEKAGAIEKALDAALRVEKVGDGKFIRGHGQEGLPDGAAALDALLAARVKFLRPLVGLPASAWRSYLTEVLLLSADSFVPAAVAAAASERTGLPTVYGRAIMRVLLGTGAFEAAASTETRNTERLLPLEHRPVRPLDAHSIQGLYRTGMTACLVRPGSEAPTADVLQWVLGECGDSGEAAVETTAHSPAVAADGTPLPA